MKVSTNRSPRYLLNTPKTVENGLHFRDRVFLEVFVRFHDMSVHRVVRVAGRGCPRRP